MTTQMAFTATVKGVKINAPKMDYSGYGSSERSSVDVTFTVKSPKQPRKPQGNHWRIERAQGTLAKFGGVAPEDPKDRKAYDAAAREIEEARVDHARELARYEAEMAEGGQQLMAYAQLVGLMAVFGGKDVQVTLSPAEQDLLPGLDLHLLEAPEPAEDDDEGFDDDWDDGDDETDEVEMVAADTVPA